MSHFVLVSVTICAITHMSDPTLDEIAQLVRAERRRQGMDQRTLALVANVGVRTVHRIEQGEATVRLDVLLRVVRALGLELAVRAGSK